MPETIEVLLSKVKIEATQSKRQIQTLVEAAEAVGRASRMEIETLKANVARVGNDLAKLKRILKSSDLISNRGGFTFTGIEEAGQPLDQPASTVANEEVK